MFWRKLMTLTLASYEKQKCRAFLSLSNKSLTLYKWEYSKPVTCLLMIYCKDIQSNVFHSNTIRNNIIWEQYKLFSLLKVRTWINMIIGPYNFMQWLLVGDRTAPIEEIHKPFVYYQLKRRKELWYEIAPVAHKYSSKYNSKYNSKYSTMKIFFFNFHLGVSLWMPLNKSSKESIFVRKATPTLIDFWKVS